MPEPVFPHRGLGERACGPFLALPFPARKLSQVDRVAQGRVRDVGVALGRAVVLVPEHLEDRE